MSTPTEGAPLPSSGAGAPPGEGPFPIGLFLVGLVVFAIAVVLGDHLLYPGLARGGALPGWAPFVILGPRLLVVLFFGARLRSFREVLGFGWGASLVAVGARFVEAQVDPQGVAARGAAGGGALFWVAGLVFWWSVFSLLYGIGACAGHLLRRPRVGPLA